MQAHKPLTPMLLTAVLALTAFAGCISAEAKGTTAIFVKDAPIDQFSHLYVTFTKVEVHQVEKRLDNESKDGDNGESQERDDKEGNETSEAGASDESGGKDSRNGTEEADKARGGADDDARDHEVEADEDHGEHEAADRAEGKWLTIVNRTATVDLRAFTGNASSFLGDADIPAGSYNGIRITVSEARGVLAANGTSVPIKVPSGALRIKGHFTVVAGKETDLTLDFNLERSVVETGHGTFLLKPVLRLASEERDRAHEDERQERQKRRDDEDRKGHADRNEERDG